MKVSVVIPVFNEEKYLPLCLDSLLTQSRPVDEIVICDNASFDQSVSVAKSYQQKLPIKIVRQSKKGIIPTVDKAWRSSTGDLILRTDADAIQPPNWVKNIERHFLDQPKLAACGGNFLSPDGNFFVKLYLRYLFFPINDAYYFSRKGHCILFGSNTAIRRFVLEAIDGYRASTPAVDDELLADKLYAAKYYFRRFDDCLNYHSARRWNNPINIIPSLMAVFINPKYYQLKSK